MDNYKRITTSAEVWAVIRARHSNDLGVFSTISEPDGDPFGNSCHCRMMTEYGFKDSDYPLIGAETTWQKHPVNEFDRVNEKHEYWLCMPLEESDA